MEKVLHWTRTYVFFRSDYVSMLSARIKLHTVIECLENLGFDDYAIQEFKTLYEPVMFFLLSFVIVQSLGLILIPQLLQNTVTKLCFRNQSHSKKTSFLQEDIIFLMLITSF